VYTQFGCHNTILAEEYISIHEIPSATFYAISNPTTIFNTEVEMINNTQGNNLTFQWSNVGGTPASSNLEFPIVIYPEGIAADYPVELIVTNEFNCVDVTTDIVHIISDVIIYAPNAFTPDNDDLNNDWRVYIDGININEFHLIMFNRWGEIVWESYDPEGVWDGTYTGNNNQDGTYVWTLIAKDATSDKKYEFKGQVTIIR
jgi:gliding motility-associated-like protein